MDYAVDIARRLLVTPHAAGDAAEEENEAVSQMSTCKSNAFLVAPIARPGGFNASIKNDNGAAQHLMDFKKGTTTLAFIFQGGILVACDSRASQGQFVASQSVRKIIEINDYLLGTMAGGAADCWYWERYLAKICRIYELQHGERISVAGASKYLSNILYNYRGYGLSCGTMIAGYDEKKKRPELYMVDDSGARVANNIFSVGSGSMFAYSVLDAGYKFDMSLEDAVELGRRSIYHATHRDAASGGRCRIYHVHERGWTMIENGQDVQELHLKYAAEKGAHPSAM